MNSSSVIGLFWQVLVSFLSQHFRTIVAVFIWWLSYRLFRLGLEKAAPTADRIEWQRYAAFVAPGVVFAFFGLALLMGHDPLSLIIYLLTFTTLIGFCFAILGYRLFSHGVLGVSDVEAVWSDKKLLMKRAAPGTLFAFFGLAMIAGTLWVSPGVLRQYSSNEQQVISVIDARAKDAFALLKQYLDQQKSVNSGGAAGR